MERSTLKISTTYRLVFKILDDNFKNAQHKNFVIHFYEFKIYSYNRIQILNQFYKSKVGRNAFAHVRIIPSNPHYIGPIRVKIKKPCHEGIFRINFNAKNIFLYSVLI